MAEVSKEARARVAKLVPNWSWPDPAILEDILALGDEAVPALAELMTPELLADAQADEQADSAVYYAVSLLGELKRPAAISLLTGMYSQFDDDDEMIEAFTDALLQIGPSSISALLQVVADGSLSYYPRMQASEAAVDLAGRDLVRRAQIAAVLRPLLAGYVARPGELNKDDKMMVAVLVDALAEVADISARPLIEAAFDTDRVGGQVHLGHGLPDMDYTSRKDIEEIFQEGGQTVFRTAESFLERYREDYRKHLVAPPRPLPPPPIPPPTVVLGSRLGRNDPCWCGSGKKYKKCHLDQDQKEKTRL